MKPLIRREPLLAFYLLAYAWTWAIGIPLLLSRRGHIAADLPHWLEPVAAFGPFIAALLVAWIVAGPDGPTRILASLKRWRVGAGNLAFATLSPVLLLVLALALVVAQGERLDFASPRLGELATIAGLLDLVLAGAILQALGEEPGWRGFALPDLRRRFGPLGATLALFPVWLLWHLPFFLSRPEFGLVQWLGFSVGILSAAVWLTLIMERSGSVLMAVIWHAMVNICRGLALAISMAAFLAIGNVVLLGAVLIVGHWLWQLRARRSRA
ncbi:MAG: CPBP family intramembrane metalloprotease [Gammaproteobacteria bacterium]|nr:CPBP family intramembrane metalloprotease [Gammaproteobacteria bacterium]